jgi:hypothetical protein
VNRVFNALKKNKPICPICYKPMKRINKYEWKPACKCSKESWGLSLG